MRRGAGRRAEATPGSVDGRADEGAALLTVVLIILVLAGLSLLVLGSVLREVRPTSATQSSSRSLFAAEAGVQAALGQVRTATATSGSGDVFGDRGRLPCALAGTVGSTQETLSYDVVVAYYTTDPARMTTSERDSKRITCNPASGPVSTPGYALLTSTGSTPAGVSPGSSPAPRVLQSIYNFKLTSTNTPGGLMYTVTQKACLQADTVAAGSKVTYVAASDCTSGAPTQMWVYAKDYAIKLASTVGTTKDGAPSELCVTGSSGEVTLRTCVPKQANQLWSYEGGAKFRGQNTGNTDYSVSCLWAGDKNNNPVGKTLKIGTGGCSASNSEWGSWSPEPRVGAGAASYETHQIVNFLEFGRCFDVTGQDVRAKFMIAYPCKQDPSGGTRLNWNHKWYYTEPADSLKVADPQTITVKENNTKTLCLQTPADGVKPAYVTLQSCDGGADQSYVRSTDTGSSLTSYTFKTSDGRCLSLGPQADASGINWSTLVAATCTGGSEQKWNAPPSLGNADLTGTREITGSGS